MNITLSQLKSKKGSTCPLTIGLFFMQENPTIVAKLPRGGNTDEEEVHERVLYIYDDKTNIYKMLSREVFYTMLLDMITKYNIIEAWKGSSTKSEAWRVLVSSSSIPSVPMDEEDGLISYKNGILDLKTKVLHKHSKDFYFSSKLNHDYDPTATECPRFNKFLDEVFSGDKDLIQNLNMLGGYLLVPHMKAEKMFFFDGPGGAGKSTIIKIFQEMFSEEQQTAIDLDRLADKNAYERIGLVRSRVNFSAEAKQGYLESEELKKIVTGDKIIVRQIYGKPMTIITKAKSVTACNGMPRTKDTSEGMYRRLCIFNFKNRFKSEADMTDRDRKSPHVFLKDKNLIDELLKELPAIFNQFIRGLQELKAKDWDFNVSTEAEKYLEDYKSSSDSFREFLMDNYEYHEGAEEPVTSVLQSYRDWHKTHVSSGGNVKMRTQEVGRRIKEYLDVDPNPNKVVVQELGFEGSHSDKQRVTSYQIRKIQIEDNTLPDF